MKSSCFVGRRFKRLGDRLFDNWQAKGCWYVDFHWQRWSADPRDRWRREMEDRDNRPGILETYRRRGQRGVAVKIQS